MKFINYARPYPIKSTTKIAAKANLERRNLVEERLDRKLQGVRSSAPAFINY